jgi:transcriptional regulator with XRE-family HTH domain
MTQEVIFAHVLKRLMEERYRRNRARLAVQVHISPSAISQYVCGRATPSLDILVHLADVLDVSLDYLVFGKEPAPMAPELGYLVGHFESHTRGVEARGISLHDLVARIGARVVTQIRSTAEELLNDPRSLGGMLNPDDVIPIERCSVRTTILTTDLSREVLVFQQGEENVAAPSMFAQLIADNIRANVHYEYIVPKAAEWIETARYLRQEIVRLSELDLSHVERYLHIFHVNNACVPGFVVQHVVLEKLQRRAPDVLDRIVQFIHTDPENKGMGFVAYSEPMNPGNEKFSLISKQNIPSILEDLSAHRRMSIRS